MSNRIIQFARSLLRREESERELDDEIQFHLEREIESNIKAGMSMKQAKREAKQSLGGPTQVRESCREVRPGALLETIFQDVRFGLRSLRKNPGFTSVVVLILALGIGANVGIFSLSNSFFLRPLPFSKPDQLMRLYGESEMFGSHIAISYPNYRDLRDRNQVFANLAAHLRTTSSVELGEDTIPMQSEFVSGNYFQMLASSPLMGRTLSPTDDLNPGGHPVVVISHNAWRNIYNESPGVLGESLKINGDDFTIVGVMPKSFRGTFPTYPVDLWLPISMSKSIDQEQRGMSWLQGTGRLKEGVSPEQARSEMQLLSAQLAEEFPRFNQGTSFTVVEARIMPDGMGSTLEVIIGFTSVIAALVLILTCANIASILLARTMSRRQEMAIRQSLGATRGRLIRQLFTETMLLAGLGMALGLIVAIWTGHLVIALIPPMPFLAGFEPEATLDYRMFIFASSVTLLTGFVLSLFTVVRLETGYTFQAMQVSTTQTTTNPERARLQGALVVGQVGLSFVLLVAAGLLLRTLDAAANFNVGFNTDNILVAYLPLSRQTYDEDRGKAFHHQLAERLQALPGVQAVSNASIVPLSGSSNTMGFQIEGHEATTEQGTVTISYNTISQGYFNMMGIPLLQGREFDAQDAHPGAPPVAIINETLAKQYWSDENPLGKTVRISADDITCTITGVVADINYNALGESPQPFIYLSFDQNYSRYTTLQVRTSSVSASLIPAIKREVNALDPTLKMAELSSLNDYRQAQMLPQKYLAAVSAIFGSIALLLTAIGLYGTISYLARQRTHEIGIRMALGAQPIHVAKMILHRGLVLTIAGGILGLTAAFFLTRFMESWLFEVAPTDPVTFIGVSLLLLVVAGLASVLPARRAMKVDPMTALRCD